MRKNVILFGAMLMMASSAMAQSSGRYQKCNLAADRESAEWQCQQGPLQCHRQ